MRASVLAVAFLVSSSAFAKGGPRISIADDPTHKEGSPALVFIEVGDFQCPYCGKGSRDLVPRIYEHFVKTGRVELVSLDNPLPMHPDAFRAAQAAACAEEQGKFWEMRTELFGNQDALGAAQLAERAEGACLDVPAFQKCLAAHRHDGAIREDMRTVQNLGITGTPAYLIGRRIEGGDKVEVLEVVKGLPEWEELEAKVKAYLETPPPPPRPPRSTSPRPAPSTPRARR